MERRLGIVTRARAVLALTAAVVGALAATTAADARTNADFVAVLSFPKTVNVGQNVAITGWVSTNAGRVAGIDVTVRRYTTLHCSGKSTSVAVLTTGPNGTFSFTEQLAVTPPVAYGFIPTDPTNPNRVPNFNRGDACVNIGAGPRLNATAQGNVTVDGTPFKGGVIGYGSTVDLAVGSAVNISTDAGAFKFFPAVGNSSSFVPVRVRVPAPKGKKTKPHYVIELRLVGGNLASCKKTKKLQGYRTEQATKNPPTRSLWGNGKGQYRTRGRYSSATVTGTIWLVQDSCNGTLTLVKRGVVRVKDFVKNRTVLVFAGHQYLAVPR